MHQFIYISLLYFFWFAYNFTAPIHLQSTAKVKIKKLSVFVACNMIWKNVEISKIPLFLRPAEKKFFQNIFSRVQATLHPALSVGLSVRHTITFLSILFL